MGSKTPAKATIFLATNLLCFVLTTCGNPSPPTLPPPTVGGQSVTWPADVLKLGTCAKLLGGLMGMLIGDPPTTTCCTFLAGLAELEAAVCLCTAIRANLLGINLNVEFSLNLLLFLCGRTPTGFTCAWLNNLLSDLMLNMCMQLELFFVIK